MKNFNAVREYLTSLAGTPYFVTDNCVLFNVDTLSVLGRADRQLFDAVITSPPYNTGREYET